MSKKLKVIKFILIVAFFGAGLSKFLMPGMEEAFRIWGYPDWFRIVVGVGEVVATVLLLMPKWTKLVAGLLALEMIGAVVTHVRVGQFEQLPLPIALLVLSAILYRKLK